ncbi:ribonuclease domain-containing protein [Paenibacillus sp. NPDC058071]|uniref:ribonuclease domain-containing protein n=1 Tax=Paenibacillus sp. NPDC058071 TaxID=3346326 RepID=UPI0036D89FF6
MQIIKWTRTLFGIVLALLLLAGCGANLLDSSNSQPADALTGFEEVAGYVKANGKLPDNFLTKKEARELGWDAKEGNLNTVAPGKSIGGDVFYNREGKLPAAKGRTWYEADIHYVSGHRGKDRLLYSNDGLIYKTEDHYKTFTQIE